VHNTEGSEDSKGQDPESTTRSLILSRNESLREASRNGNPSPQDSFLELGVHSPVILNEGAGRV